MMKRNLIGMFATVACLAAGLVATTGCHRHEGSEDQMKGDIDSFVTLYYNWHFQEAAKYCTPSSERWLRYAASNVHKGDIKQLHQKEEDATHEINDVEYGDDGGTAVIYLTVFNFLQMDTIGQEAHLIPQADIELPMEMQGGMWKVKLDKLP